MGEWGTFKKVKEKAYSQGQANKSEVIKQIKRCLDERLEGRRIG